MDTFNPVGKALSNWGNSSPMKRESSSVQRAIDNRMTLSDAIDAATEIIGRYPNGGANAGKSYIGALAATLASYPLSVAAACSGLTGVSAECKFLPTVADIIAWCERETQPLYRQADREYRLKEQFELRDQAPKSAESKARVKAMHEAIDRDTAAARELSVRSEANEKRAAAARDRRLREVRREWGDQEPPTLAGVPVSRELVETMRRTAE